MASFQSICDFVSVCRGVSGKGSIKLKEEKAGHIGKLLKGLTTDRVTAYLATLFPQHHPEKYMPIGLTTLAYSLREIALQTRGSRVACVSKGENPFDWIATSDHLCMAKTKDELAVDVIQRGIKMMYKTVGATKCMNLKCILEACTPEQGRIFCEILGCSLVFGFGIKHFLESFGDENIVKTWIMTNSIEKVAHTIVHGDVCPLTVGYYISSMLARQKPFNTGTEAFEFIENGGSSRKRKNPGSGNYIAQLKIDGYRIQLHRDRKANRFWYYSRHNLDLADTFFFNVLNDSIDNSIKANDYILDGEVIAFDDRTLDFVPCSEMGTFVWMKDPHIKLVYFVFDVLYYDGVQCIGMPYSKRLELLERIVTPQRNGHMVIPMVMNAHEWNKVPLARKVQNGTDADTYFDNVIKHDLEGIMIKDLASTWEPYGRSNAHLKVKPTPSAYDLYIVGANMNRMQIVASLLLAYKDDAQYQYYTLCMCGTGLTHKARQLITTVIAESATWSSKGGHNTPSWLHIYGDERPHMFLQEPMPCKVTAHKMTNSKVYAGGKTLRFPVIREIPSINYIKEDGKAAVFTGDTSIPVEIGYVQQESDILADTHVWILKTHNDALMSELMRNVLRMGGKCVKDPFAEEIEPDIIIVPEQAVDETDLDIAHTRMSDIPKVRADWLRKTYLWMEVMPHGEFLL